MQNCRSVAATWSLAPTYIFITFSFPHNRVTTKHGYQIKSCYRLHYGGKGRNCAVLLSPS
ncbi:hypothetical protein ALC62_06113 [Cyphomyrmex costatus]|uniref:Uncharacterized protein n=1 Tax=Cyphomyrmex costatus TaxID=456900 RepID=A0A195CSD2_9HYME|nr:hypothetical protein ALC62_06113 [Cyphomyrmex costatus]